MARAIACARSEQDADRYQKRPLRRITFEELDPRRPAAEGYPERYAARKLAGADGVPHTDSKGRDAAARKIGAGGAQSRQKFLNRVGANSA